ncbi:hypothetical protein AAVH_02729 [Aphelenchoides avenae]|nr:hypothetical protein AAVH_02729 [Aphelenchus avenae]
MAFNFIDMNGDGICSEEEIGYLADTPLNGLRFKGKAQTSQLFKAMDTNGNGKVSEQEFVSFDKWLPVVVNGKGQNRKVALKTLRSLTAHDGSEFASLDMNQDGYIDEREITLDPLRKTHAL